MVSTPIIDVLKNQLPVEQESLELTEGVCYGLVVVDIINGFCTVGAGPLAPTEHNKQISDMINEAERLAKLFSEKNWPPHCLAGSEESNLVSALRWLEDEPNVTIRRKDCYDGFIGSIQNHGSNVFVNWVKANFIGSWSLHRYLCAGLRLLNFISKNSRGFLSPLQDVVVYSNGCATFEVAQNSKHGPAHPQEIMHHMGLYMAKERGAKIVSSIAGL